MAAARSATEAWQLANAELTSHRAQIEQLKFKIDDRSRRTTREDVDTLEEVRQSLPAVQAAHDEAAQSLSEAKEFAESIRADWLAGFDQ